ncbi:MAG: precorrin-3B synthase [Hyphomicrobiaceae bacterium]|nr:precorrin-3B synthase [Hyphomicrobiaceae bacterium]
MTAAPESRRRGWCPGALRPMQSGDGLLVRIKPSCGMVSLEQAEAIATLARDHGNGLIDLTSRGNLQLRGVSGETLDVLTSALDALGLLDATPEAEAVRNVISSPLAGIDVTAFDTRSVVKALEQRVTSDSSLGALSDKFGFLVDGGGMQPLADVEADIRFVWTGDHFAVGLARESGCDWIGTCSPGDVPDVAIALARSFLIHAGSVRRVRHLSDGERDQISKTAAVETRGQTHGSDPMRNVAVSNNRNTAFNDAHGLLTPIPSSRRRPGSTQVATGVTPQDLARHTSSGTVEQADAGVDPGLRRDDVGTGSGCGDWSESGTAAAVEARGQTHGSDPMRNVAVRFSPNIALNGPRGVGVVEAGGGSSVAGIGLPYGGTTSTALLSLMALARQAGATELRLTPWRAILIATADRDAAAFLLTQAAGLGFITDPADTRRAIAACPGAPACASGTTPVRADADLLAKAAANLLGDGVDIHVSGCAKGCAHRQAATLTIVADGGVYGLVVNGTAANAACGRYTAPEIAEILARVPSAVTKAGDVSHTKRGAAIAAALKEILAA